MERAVVSRTVVVKSERLPRRVFRVFAELEGMYGSMVEQLTLYAAGNKVTTESLAIYGGDEC